MQPNMQDLLERAKAGDQEARGRVAVYVFTLYSSRMDKLYTVDPAFDPDDMRSTFFEGIYRHVPKADERGDPFYHIGQRGYWAVLSALRAVALSVSHREMIPPGDDGEEWADQIPDPENAGRFDLVIDALDASVRINALPTRDLKGRSREVWEIIRSGAAGDPTEPGFNQRLAGELGVSPQRASQVMNTLREDLSA